VRVREISLSPNLCGGEGGGSASFTFQKRNRPAAMAVTEPAKMIARFLVTRGLNDWRGEMAREKGNGALE
jgi:hypothetical protein